MKLFLALAALAGVAVSAAVMPGDKAGACSSNPNDYKQYYLKTVQVAHSKFHPLQNNSYVEPYHTGAGLNDATLGKQKVTPVYLNGTQLLFHVNEGDQPFYPYGMVMTSYEPYAAWIAVEINVGYGPGVGEFFFNTTGLQWSSSRGNPAEDEFAGWRICNWSHNVPQLFWKLKYYEQSLPSSCSDVYLMPEAV